MTLILITGSRDWCDVDAISREFDVLERGAASAPSGEGVREFAVMHGACPLRQLPDGRMGSADAHAGSLARMRGWDVLERPAVWTDAKRKFDPCAGFARNSLMVREAADHVKRGGLAVVLAFLMPCSKVTCRTPVDHGSHGTQHCVDEAVKADLPILIIRSS